MNRCLSVYGSRGTGKTSTVHALLIDYEVRRRIIIDPLRDYSTKVERECFGRDDVHAYLDDDRLKDPSRPFSVSYVPADAEEADAAIYCAEWARYLQSCTLILEEAHDAANHTNCPPELIRLVKRGRHYGDDGVGVWCVSQRPSDVAPNLRAELHSSESWYLRLAETNDLDVLTKRRGREFSERVATLPNLRALRLTPGERTPEEWQIGFSEHPYLTRMR